MYGDSSARSNNVLHQLQPLRIDRAARANAEFQIVGDSMQPGILHNDTVTLVQRAPREGDVVAIRAHAPHDIFGKVFATIWRYHEAHHKPFLTKDNPRYRGTQPVEPAQVVGVVERVHPRTYREERENLRRIAHDIALFRACNIAPHADLGFIRDWRRDELKAVLNIPRSELIGGRLPWGLFRAKPRSDHPHSGITRRDTLTIDPCPDSHVGQLVISRCNNGETIIGTMQREHLDTPAPGEFYVDLGERRVFLTGCNDGIPEWRTIGVVADIQHRKRTCT